MAALHNLGVLVNCQLNAHVIRSYKLMDNRITYAWYYTYLITLQILGVTQVSFQSLSEQVQPLNASL